MRAVLYARVSTELQEKEQTIQSQLEALRQYALTCGYMIVQEFIDDGYSGATLDRPGLDRLRDALGDGDFDLVLVHSPDRLARKAVYQGILLEEFEKAGVKVEFLNCPVEDSPEGKMLLGMQALFAEYERAKILERTRRGRLHRVRQGHMVGPKAPYGYRYIRRNGSEEGHFVVVGEESRVVREMYRWLLEEELSLRAIARRLTDLLPTQQGKSRWGVSTVQSILHNEFYAGTGNYYKWRPQEPQRHRSIKPYRRYAKTSRRLRPIEEWIPFSVLAIIDRQTWEAAQAKFKKNAAFASRNNIKFHYLLRGLIRCGPCGCAMGGSPNKGHTYYRCGGKDTRYRDERCRSRAVRAEKIDKLVWSEVTRLLRDPEVLAQECRRRLSQAQAQEDYEAREKQAAIALKRIKAQEDRFIDAYKNEVLDLERFKDEMGKLKARRQEIERQQAEIERLRQDRDHATRALERVEAFRQELSKGLAELTFEERQKVLRLLVDRIVVDGSKVTIHAILPLQQPKDSIGLRPFSRG